MLNPTRDIDFHLTKGDTANNVLSTLRDSEGDVVDLSNVRDVRFEMVSVSTGEQVVDESATIGVAKKGEVIYDWSEGDTDTQGKHHAEFEVTYITGDVQTFPNDKPLLVYIERPAV